MYTIRLSTSADIPAIRELWTLCFGDNGDYMDTFLTHCHALHPDRTLVLEEEGLVRSMTTWMETVFMLPDGTQYPAAYIYAVATHPEARSRGFAAKVLAWAEEHLRTLGFSAMTTVPSEPSLHRYYGSLGFRECFCHEELRVIPAVGGDCSCSLTPVTPAAYGKLRESLLTDLPHIVFPEYLLAFQRGCSALSGGDLYQVSTPCGPAALCAEGLEDGSLLVKELLAPPAVRENLPAALPQLLPAFSGVYRRPGTAVPFGMLKWLDRESEARWDWNSTAYLGLAFD